MQSSGGLNYFPKKGCRCSVRVLGIDPGSVKCGYAILEREGVDLRYVEAGVLSAKGHKWERIGIIGNELRALLAEHTWGLDDLCGVETAYIPVGRFYGVEALAEARGALCFVAMRAGLNILTVSPSTVKKAVTGSGRAEKDRVASAVATILGLSRPPDPDAADALGVAIAIARGSRA